MKTFWLLLPLLAVGCADTAEYTNNFRELQVIGAQVVVIDAQGEVWHGEKGEQDRGVNITEGTAFLLGETTMSYTAAVVLQLVEEGALGLDDAASTWVPGLSDAITVRMLLQHTTGLGDYFDDEQLADPDQDYVTEQRSPEDLISLGLDQADDGPQEVSRLASTNYIALGMIIEAVTGQALPDAMQQRLFDVVDMPRSGLMLPDEEPENMALGEGGDFDQISWINPSLGWAAGSAWSNAYDLANFTRALHGADLYGQDLVDEQEARGPWGGLDEDGVESTYGLGLMAFDLDGLSVVGHMGNWYGFTSVVVLDRETSSVVSVLANEDGAEGRLIPAALDSLRIAVER